MPVGYASSEANQNECLILKICIYLAGVTWKFIRIEKWKSGADVIFQKKREKERGQKLEVYHHLSSASQTWMCSESPWMRSWLSRSGVRPQFCISNTISRCYWCFLSQDHADLPMDIEDCRYRNHRERGPEGELEMFKGQEQIQDWGCGKQKGRDCQRMPSHAAGGSRLKGTLYLAIARPRDDLRKAI